MWSNKVSPNYAWCETLLNSLLDDFEVSIFLTEIRTRHSLLVKNKTFKQKMPLRTNNGSILTGIDRDAVMIQDESDDENVDLARIPQVEDTKDIGDNSNDAEEDFDARMEDDKKKLGFKTNYEGFSIWGWVLCLFIERKGGPGKKSGAEGNAQALMQDWIQSTQEQKNDDL